MRTVHSARYKRYQSDGELFGDSDCKFTLSDTALVINPNEAGEIKLEFTELENLNFKGRQVKFVTPDGERIELYYLSQFSEVSAKIQKVRTDEIIKHLLIPDSKFIASFKGHFRFFKEANKAPLEDAAEIRIFNSFLIVIPQITDIFIVLFGDLKSSSVDKENKSYSLNMYTGEKLEISYLGEHFTDFEKSLGELIEGFEETVKQRLLKIILGVSPEDAQGLANLMRDGRAVEKKEIERVTSSLWKSLEELIPEDGGYKKSYEFLKSRTTLIGKVRIGTRKLGGETSVWYQMPLEARTSSYIAVECIEKAKHDTLFFRVLKTNGADLGRTMDLINKTLIFLDFNLTALYMTENDIMEGSRERLKVILKKFDFLMDLRALFFFRISFRDYQKWESDLRIVLGLN